MIGQNMQVWEKANGGGDWRVKINNLTPLYPPPRSTHTLATADCSSACTRKLLDRDIYVTEAVNHMHYLGGFYSWLLYDYNILW